MMRIVYAGDSVTYHPQLGILVPGVETEVSAEHEAVARLAAEGGLVRLVAPSPPFRPESEFGEDER